MTDEKKVEKKDMQGMIEANAKPAGQEKKKIVSNAQAIRELKKRADTVRRFLLDSGRKSTIDSRYGKFKKEAK